MISPRPDLLALDASQFHEVCKAINVTHNTDPKKNAFKQGLLQLSNSLLSEDIYAMPATSINERLSLVGIFLGWALALDNRNGYTLSKEMRSLLDNLCAKWIPDPEKYVFAVTDGDFSIMERYDPNIELTLENVKNLFGIVFPHKLVIFCSPKHLAGDFLYSCVLYHEMGHFVDAYYNISNQIFDDLNDKLTKGTLDLGYMNQFFPLPLLLMRDPRKFRFCLKNQIGEYVADLFGAQYVGKNICNLLESLCRNHYDDIRDIDHPSPNHREKMVCDFINGVTTNELLNQILKEFSNKGHELKVRYHGIADEAKLKAGEPLSINSDDELHSIINLGWEVYFSKASTMEALMGVPSNSIDNYSFYNIINEGIKASIENYFPH